MPRSGVPTPTPFPVELPITLGQFVKAAGLAATGGEAKQMIVSGLVSVNAVVDTRRGRHLAVGDIVQAEGTALRLVAEAGPESAGHSGKPANPQFPRD